MAKLDTELPRLIMRLVEKADEGDRDALIYLIDRRMGKPRQQTELDIKGGHELGTGTIVELFKLMAQRKAELEAPLEACEPLSIPPPTISLQPLETQTSPIENDL
jgi:hypothetical protein